MSTMATKTALKTLVKKMKEYQNNHNIKDECFVNSFIFAQIARVLGFPKAKILPVYVIYEIVHEGEYIMVVAIHMCVNLGGNNSDEVADVSIQYADMNNAEYFRTWAELTKVYPSLTQHTHMKGLSLRVSNEMSSASGKGALAKFMEYEGFAKKLNHFLDENPDVDGIGMCPFGSKRIPYYDNMMEHILPTIASLLSPWIIRNT